MYVLTTPSLRIGNRRPNALGRSTPVDIGETTESIKNKLDLLKLADKLGSVGRACKAMGFSR
jgi:hypothetical protein